MGCLAEPLGERLTVRDRESSFRDAASRLNFNENELLLS